MQYLPYYAPGKGCFTMQRTYVFHGLVGKKFLNHLVNLDDEDGEKHNILVVFLIDFCFTVVL